MSNSEKVLLRFIPAPLEAIQRCHFLYCIMSAPNCQPGFDERVARGFLQRATLMRVQGYTRLRFIRQPAPVPVPQPCESKSMPPLSIPALLHSLNEASRSLGQRGKVFGV